MINRKGGGTTMEDHLIFVYGTLRKGEANHGLMKGFECVAGQAWTAGTLWDTGKGYPALAPDNGSGSVVYGEVYRIPRERPGTNLNGLVGLDGLDELDELEDYYGPNDPRNEYERVRAQISTDSGVLEAWIYTYPPENTSGLEPISSGDWKVARLLGMLGEGEDPSPPAGEMLYFAYGSCMDDRRFRLDGAAEYFRHEAGRGIAGGYSLGFTCRAADGGRADMIETGGAAVEGKLYRIGGEALSYLWRREGVGAGVYRPAIIRVHSNETGGEVEALTFLVVNKEEETAPPDWYLEEIVRGAGTVVSGAYLQRLKEQFRDRFGYEG